LKTGGGNGFKKCTISSGFKKIFTNSFNLKEAALRIRDLGLGVVSPKGSGSRISFSRSRILDLEFRNLDLKSRIPAMSFNSIYIREIPFRNMEKDEKSNFLMKIYL
jgi:hypothetical protein